jgi:hypothetical protein
VSAPNEPVLANLGLTAADFTRAFPTARLGWCRACQKDKHRDCDLHMNDGAGDAEDFVAVSCACPCEGEVRGKLIDLVAALRRDADERETLLAARDGSAQRLWAGLDQVLVSLTRLITDGYDDEGEWTSTPPDLEAIIVAAAPLLSAETPQ